MLSISHDAFPGAQHLLPLVAKADSLAQQLDKERNGGLNAGQVKQNRVDAYDIFHDGVETYRSSLAQLGFRSASADMAPAKISTSELREMHGSLVLLSAGLEHYIHKGDTEAALRGIAHFRGTFSALLKERLTVVLSTKTDLLGNADTDHSIN